MNVLLTGAGRRTGLVHFFRRALRGRGVVIACDSSPTAPALAEADRAMLVPPFDAPDYVEVLFALCRAQAVRLILSVNDLELIGLAEAAPRFRAAGTIPVVAVPEVIALCQDKWAAYRALCAVGIPTPDTYLSIDEARQAIARGTLRFPLVVKPRWGSTSIGVEIVHDERELALAWEWGRAQALRTTPPRWRRADPERCLIVQEFLRGSEYGLDVINDLNGRHVATLARRKLAMRAGNTDRAVSVADPQLDALGRALGELLGHPGCLDVDAVAVGGSYRVLDLNPRLGGGYPFAHLAGADLPAALLAWAAGEEADPAWLRCRPGVIVAKHDGLSVLDRDIPTAAFTPVTGAAACGQEPATVRTTTH